MTGNHEQPQSRAEDVARRLAGFYHVGTSATGYTPRYDFTCQRCGGTWRQEREQPPARCPHCGYLRWKDPPEARACVHCGHVWQVPQGHPRGKCPACHSRSWDGKPKNAK